MLPGMQRVWRHEPSHSQVNSHVGSWSPERTPESSEHDCRGQNSLPWGILYIIGKLLKCRCLKWARIAHLDICNTSYGQMNGRESNWQFDSRPLKVGNRPHLLGCRRHVTYRWKALGEGYNFAWDRVAIGGLHKKLCALEVVGVPVDAISGLPLGSPGTKSHLDVAPVEKRRVYYKGEGDGFPQVWAVVSLVCPGCPCLVLAPKVLQLCSNHLVLVLCRSVWVNKACHIFLVPSRSSNTPLYPSIVLRAREHAPTPCPSIVLSLGLKFEFRKELGVRQMPFGASKDLKALLFLSWLLFSSKNFNYIAKSVSILHLKSGNISKPSYFPTSTPLGHTPHRHGWPIINNWSLKWRHCDK
jgi:hypothetical protein